jgi:hypothetical protein
VASKREAELEAIVRILMPAIHDVMWCALVWNDHNFTERDLLDKLDRAAKALGCPRHGLGSGVDEYNVLLDRMQKALGDTQQHSEGQK